MEEELRPCPFCGSDDIDAKGWKGNDGSVGPCCNNCNATADSIEIWNTRATDPIIEEVAEKIAIMHINDQLLKQMAEALESADKFADGYHWAICSSVRNKIKQALQTYRDHVGQIEKPEREGE